MRACTLAFALAFAFPLALAFAFPLALGPGIEPPAIARGF